MNIPIIVVVGGVVAIVVAFWLLHHRANELRKCETSLKSAREEIRNKDSALTDVRAQLTRASTSYEEAKRLLAEKSAAMPWIAGLIADLYWAQDERDAHHLRRKSHPALKAAETVRLHAQEKKQLRIEKRFVEYRLALIESLFPWSREIGFSDAEEIAEAKIRNDLDDADPASNWLSKDEWLRLPPTERFQRALDRYKKTRKSTWQIGREYERYIGYLWEENGYDVIYFGATKGFDDFGRDLIATDANGKVALIQCKLWSQHKTIPEAAIFQLLGTTVSYYIERNGNVPPDLPTLFSAVQPYLYSSTVVAPRIRDIAVTMGIDIQDNVAMNDWPMVKCNVNNRGERIFHLPMDQQYDRVKISKPGECYAWTVAEAEAKDFRRAMRWKGVGADGEIAE